MILFQNQFKNPSLQKPKTGAPKIPNQKPGHPSVDDPNTRFTHSTVPYQDVSGTVIANNWAGLTSGTLVNAITTTETGGSNSNAVWTNVATNGTATNSGSSSTYNCTAWTITTGSKHANVGTSGSATSTWTVLSSDVCSVSLPLYCFQQ